MLLEATADVERTTRLAPPYHGLHIGRCDDGQPKLAKHRKGIALEPSHQPSSMPSIKRVEAVAMPFAHRFLEGHLSPQLVGSTGIPPSPGTTFTLARRSRASASETAG